MQDANGPVNSQYRLDSDLVNKNNDQKEETKVPQPTHNAQKIPT